MADSSVIVHSLLRFHDTWLTPLLQFTRSLAFMIHGLILCYSSLFPGYYGTIAVSNQFSILGCHGPMTVFIQSSLHTVAVIQSPSVSRLFLGCHGPIAASLCQSTIPWLSWSHSCLPLLVYCSLAFMVPQLPPLDSLLFLGFHDPIAVYTLSSLLFPGCQGPISVSPCQSIVPWLSWTRANLPSQSTAILL